MKKINLCIALFSLIISIGGTVKADNAQPMGGYSIEGVQNVHQIDKNVSYFHLCEHPSEEDKIKVKLINESSQDKQLSVKVVDGNTNINGDIDYTGSIKNNVKLVQPLTSVLKTTQSKVSVPKHSIVETTLNLKMPLSSFEGIILGGIVVSEAQNPLKQSSTVTSTYSYTLGVVLTNSKTVEMKKNIGVSLDKIGAKLFDGKKVVEADILNDNPFIFSGGKISALIKNKKNGKVIKKISKGNISIAPYSAFPLQFDWKRSDLEAGTYVFSGIFEDGKKTWKLEKEFTILKNQASSINKESTFQVIIPFWLQLVEIISFFGVTISIIYNFKQIRRINSNV